MTEAEANTGVLHDRPEGEIPSGLRQEARDPYTRAGNQITDMLPGPHLCIYGSGHGGSRLAQRQGEQEQ